MNKHLIHCGNEFLRLTRHCVNISLFQFWICCLCFIECLLVLTWERVNRTAQFTFSILFIIWYSFIFFLIYFPSQLNIPKLFNIWKSFHASVCIHPTPIYFGIYPFWDGMIRKKVFPMSMYHWFIYYTGKLLKV